MNQNIKDASWDLGHRQPATHDANDENHQVKIDVDSSRPQIPILLDYGFRPPLVGANVWLTPEQAAWSCCLPFLGRIRVVKDPIGLLSASVILFYWIYNVGCNFFIILLPRYYGGSLSVVLLIFYGIIAFLCIVSFFRAVTTNPGALSSSESHQNGWNVCVKCNLARPNGTHHCRRCGQCVRKMDHHCPWINNCVGEDNQFVFMLLVFYAHVLSIFCLVLNIFTLYNYLPCEFCPEVTFLGIGERKLLWASVFMAVSMSCGGFGLYMTQHISIIFDLPSMEWNRMQMEFFQTGRWPQVWPKQTRNVMTAYRSTCGQGRIFCWMNPCRKRQSPISFYSKENLV